MSEFKYRNVMIIDDNDIDLYVTSRMIKTYKVGEQVITFNSARAALEYLQQNAGDASQIPDVMLVDIYMPLMSGFEFMEAYRDFPEDIKQKCRIYIISSSIDELIFGALTPTLMYVPFMKSLSPVIFCKISCKTMV